MENSFRDKQKKSYDTMRTVYNLTMGIIILGIGVVLLFNNKLGMDLSIDPMMLYSFSGLCILYGSFRLYRGIKKNY
jgi:hypothetical protein